MRAMILKEFRQMRRDRRTVALMVGLAADDAGHLRLRRSLRRHRDRHRGGRARARTP